jgi:high-affinity iron transporter
MPSLRLRLPLPFLAIAAAAVLGGCHRRARPDWDLTAFALEMVVDEYPELGERGDFHEVPSLVAVLDRARAALGPPRKQTRRFVVGLDGLRASLLRHEAPMAVARNTAQLLAELEKSGVPLKRPRALPDLARGAATYAVACTPCHGPPRGPPPAAAAHMVPPPPRPLESAITPYQVYSRVSYGGLGTAMPSFSETLTEDLRWDIAFYLFADPWPPCRDDRPLPALTASELAHLSDYELWVRFGWGAAPCLRRQFR